MDRQKQLHAVATRTDQNTRKSAPPGPRWDSICNIIYLIFIAYYSVFLLQYSYRSYISFFKGGGIILTQPIQVTSCIVLIMFFLNVQCTCIMLVVLSFFIHIAVSATCVRGFSSLFVEAYLLFNKFEFDKCTIATTYSSEITPHTGVIIAIFFTYFYLKSPIRMICQNLA